MAINLEELYGKLYPKYGVKLCTKSCFEKSVNWIHILEDIEFVSLLRGGELILNSGYKSEEWLKKYIGLLDLANAGGLIVALRTGQMFTEEIIDYCNSIEFPLFSATWKTSYMDIIRLVSSLLLKHERKEAAQITALKNAIHNPENTEAYQEHFKEISLSKNPEYFITVLDSPPYDSGSKSIQTDKLEKSLRHTISGSVIYKENDILVILAASYKKNEIRQQFREIHEKNTNMRAGMGFPVQHICDLHRSYRTAYTAYQLAKAGLGSFLDYNELGIYKILSDIKDPFIYPAFVDETLGALFRYDEENQTDYVRILKTYFENECNSIHTAETLYFHKNTMTCKLNKIKEILGYDIAKNEQRTKIMISFYILRIGKDYFT